MATTTKSTKSSAKSKTTKKPTKTVAAKTASKTTKVTKKTVKKVAPAKKAVATTTSKVSKAASSSAPKVARVARVITGATLRKWHLASALVFALLAVAAGFVAKASTYELTLSHATKDDLASKSQTVFAPAAHVITDLDIRVLLIAVLAVSAVFALLRATRLQVVEEKGLAARVLPWRWIDLAVTFGALVGVIALLAGVHDLIAIKLLAFTIVVSYFFAWLAERNTPQSRLFAKVGVVIGIVPWLFIALAMAGTAVYGDVRYTWYVYAAAAALFLSQLGIAKLQKSTAARNYLSLERDYIVLNLLAKLAVAAILISGLRG